MAHLVPVSRWFGFLHGYAVAGAVSMAGAYQVGGSLLVGLLLPFLRTGVVFVAGWALIRTIFALHWARKERRDAANKAESLTSAGAVGHRAGRL